MEILYLTDVHDNLKGLRCIVKKTKADLYVFSGDLIYKAFCTENKLYRYLELQDEFQNFLAKEKLEMTPFELSVQIMEFPEKYGKEWEEKADSYRILFKQAAENMKNRYQIIHDLVCKYANAPVMFLPGNYDMDLQYTALYKLDMHKKCKTIDGVKFAGYGGAPVFTPGIPQKISVVFDEYREKDKLFSEPYNFFSHCDPHILLIHNPAYGTLDKIQGRGHHGSWGIRNFIDEYSPKVVLSGHVHEDYGILKIGKTWCINPANFGGVDSLYGYQEGGSFVKLELRKGSDSDVYLRKVTLFRLSKKEIYPLVDIEMDKNLRASEKTLNQDLFPGEFIR